VTLRSIAGLDRGVTSPRRPLAGADGCFAAVSLGYGQDVPFDASRQDAVRRLFTPEAQEASSLGDVVCLDDLVRWKRGAAEGADLAVPDEVGQHAEGLLEVSVPVGPVHLLKVDVVGLEPAQARLERTSEVTARVAGPVGAFHEGEVALGGEDDLFPSPLKGRTHDLLGLSGRVHVGRVEEVDAVVECPVDEADTLVPVGVAHRTEHHGPQRDR
jgi:hypothetical protein